MAYCYLPGIARQIVRAICPSRSRMVRAGGVLTAAVAAWSGMASAAEPIPTEIDPYTLEPVVEQVGFRRHGFDPYGPPSGGQPILQSWNQPTTPRHPAIFADAVKDSLTGFYGGVEYLNYRINRPSSRVFGNYTDLPDFSNPDLDGYLAPFGPDPTGVNFQAPEQPLRGLLTPGQTRTIFLDPNVSSGAGFNPDQFVANPYYDYVAILNNLFPIATVPQQVQVDRFVGVGDSVIVEGANLLAPTVRDTSAGNVPGIRGTVGYRWDNGFAVEASVFDLEQQLNPISIEADLAPRSILLPFQTPQNLTFIPILVTDLTFDLPSDGRGLVDDGDATDGLTSPDSDGNLADLTNAILPLYYDNGFAIDYTVDISGAESNVLISLPTANRHWTFDLIVGAKYFGADEAVTPALSVTNPVTGVTTITTASQTRPLFDPIDLTAVTYPNYTWDPVLGLPELGEARNTTFSSMADNSVISAQLGLKSELNLGWATLGVAPKLALGVNNVDASVTTSQLFLASDPTLTRTASWNEFATIFDLGAYARFQVREWLHASVGYQFMAVDGLAHAPDVIDFTASTADPALGVKKASDNLLMQGLTLGFEVIFP